MAEVFISYARKDQGFAKDLHDALKDANRAPWVDWHSIPPSDEWEAAIFANIEAADNFLFVISPESLRSIMCRKEVAHAVAKNKRIITILYYPIDVKELFPGIAKIQWISYPELGFKKTFQKLIVAIDTDLSWIRQHTRLSVRAKEWEDIRRNEGFLLRGLDLQEAIIWLAEATSVAERKPLLLHQQFIRASQEWEAGEILRLKDLTEEKERQRQEVERQKQEAERQSRIARGRELVAFSTLSLDEDPERGILLAMHAVNATRSDDGIVIPEAEDALHRAVLKSPIRFTMKAPDKLGQPISSATRTSPINAVAITPDGKCAISGSQNGVLAVWDISTGKNLQNFPSQRGAVTALAVTPDGKFLVTGSYTGTLKLWNIESRMELQTREAHAGWIKSLAITPDATAVVSGFADGTLDIWDLEGGGRPGREPRSAHLASINAVAMLQDGNQFVTASADNTIKVWDLKSGDCLHSLEGHKRSVTSVATSADGSVAVSASTDNTLKVWNLTSGKEKKLPLRMRAQPSRYARSFFNAVAVSADGRVAVSSSADKTLRLWDLNTGRKLLTLTGHLGPVTDVAITADGGVVVSGSSDGTLKVWNVEGGCELQILRGHVSRITRIAVSGDGKCAISASLEETREKRLKVWDLENFGESFSLQADAPVYDLALSGSGGRAVTTSLDGTLTVWNVDKRCVLKTLKHGRRRTSVALPADGGLVISGSYDGSLIIFDLDGDCEPRSLGGHGDIGIKGGAITPDGMTAVSASRDRTLKTWDVKTGREIRSFYGPQPHTDTVVAAAITSDGRIIVSGSRDRTLKIWHVGSEAEPVTLHGHQDRVNGVAISPDQKRVASASADGTVKIWELEDGRELITLASHSDQVRTVSWAQDGRILLSGGDDGIIQVYAMDTDLLMSLGRRRITRNLTAVECRKYLHRDDVPAIP